MPEPVSVSIHIEQAPDSIAAVTSAERYRVSARELHAGLKSLASISPDNLMARALLADFVVEAALKSFLAGRLHHSAILSRSPYGHDLASLWQEARIHGLNVPATVPNWCVTLNEL